MLQLQYYNKGLSKTQIEQIIKNYNLKYTTLTNEIDIKLASLIKTVLNDITPFLENIEYLSKQAKQLKELENMKNHVELLENKIKEKTLKEKELEHHINNLKQEINELKEKEKEYEKNIKTKEEIILKYELSQKNINNNIPINNNPKNKKKKKSLEASNKKVVRSSSDKKFEINKENENSKNEEYINKSINNSITNTNKTMKIQKPKNELKWNKQNKYMMNLQEITRSLAGFHENVMSNKNNVMIKKFISGSTKKEDKKITKNKKKLVNSFDIRESKNSKNMRLSSELAHVSKFKISKDEESDKEINDVVSQDNKMVELCDEEIDEEIKELEIDEQNILNIINKINNLEIEI